MYYSLSLASLSHAGDKEAGHETIIMSLVMRDENEKLRTTVYRKKTHTNRYLLFHSRHGMQVKATQ